MFWLVEQEAKLRRSEALRQADAYRLARQARPVRTGWLSCWVRKLFRKGKQWCAESGEGLQSHLHTPAEAHLRCEPST